MAIHRTHVLLLAVLAVLAVIPAGCDQSTPGGMEYIQDYDSPPRALSVNTLLAAPVVAAGANATVECAVSEEGAPIDASGAAFHVSVVVTPQAGSGTVMVSGTTATFVPTLVGAYVAKCAVTHDDGREAVDDSGEELTVVAGPPAVIDTLLAESAAAACSPVEVECVVSDAYGNPTDGLAVTGVNGSPGLGIEQSLDTYYVVAPNPGLFTAACVAGDIVDPTPAELSASNGLPAEADTQVSVAIVDPDEVVVVSCVLRDGCGNSVPGGGAFSVVPADGTSPSNAEVLIDMETHSFHAKHAGAYFVACEVPGSATGDRTPALVTVRTGLPFSWTVDLRDETCVDAAMPFPVYYQVQDIYGNVVEDAAVTVTANGMPLDPIGVATYRLPGDGIFTIEVMLDGPFQAAADIQPVTAGITVDSTPPVITFTKPTRAQALAEGTLDDSNVEITGVVADTMSEVSYFKLNNVVWTVPPASSSMPFTQSQSSHWGMNIISGYVEDSCGNGHSFAQSYLRSPTYFAAAAAPAPAARVPQGGIIHLNAPIIDDGDRTDLDDFATLAQTIIGGINLNDSLPDPLACDPDTNHDGNIDKHPCDCGLWEADATATGFRARATGAITYSDLRINAISPVNGGLRLAMGLRNLVLPLSVLGTYRVCVTSCFGAPTPNATVNGTVRLQTLSADARIAVTTLGGVPQVSICDGCLNIGYTCPSGSGCPLDIDWGFLEKIGLGDFLDGFTDLIVRAFEGQILGALEDQIRQLIPPLLEDALTLIALDQSITLPAPIDTTLVVSTSLDAAVFCGADDGLTKPASCPATNPNPGYGVLGMSTQVYPTARGASIPATATGAIRRNGVPPTFPSGAGANEFGLALKDDFINQLLWAMWYGGALDLSIADLQPLVGELPAGIDAHLTALSPPVLRSKGEQQVEIGIGDLYLTGSFDLGIPLNLPPGTKVVDLGVYVSGIVGGTIDFDPTTNTLIAALDLQPGDLWIDVADLTDPSLRGALEGILEQLAAELLPSLLQQVVGSFVIPSFDLSQIAGLPPGTVWTLTNGEIARAPDFYMVSGSLQ